MTHARGKWHCVCSNHASLSFAGWVAVMLRYVRLSSLLFSDSVQATWLWSDAFRSVYADYLQSNLYWAQKAAMNNLLKRNCKFTMNCKRTSHLLKCFIVRIAVWNKCQQCFSEFSTAQGRRMDINEHLKCCKTQGWCYDDCKYFICKNIFLKIWSHSIQFS